MATTDFTLETHADTGAGDSGPMLVWRFPAPLRAISSAMLGGGITDAAWVLNAHVRADYARMDPADHLREVARSADLGASAGVGLMTAARVERVATAYDGPVGALVRCDATVGVSYPTWAAAPDDEPVPDRPWRPGTINIVCQLPVQLTDSALVGAVVTATEAKSQALVEGGMPGTGTASDAIVICCPRAGGVHGLDHAEPVPFAGPRSPWGARLARAVHAAVSDGLADYLARQ